MSGCEAGMWNTVDHLHVNENDHIFGGWGSLDVPVTKVQLNTSKMHNYTKNKEQFWKANTPPWSSSDVIQVDFIRWFPRCSWKKTIFIQIFPQTVNKHQAWHKHQQTQEVELTTGWVGTWVVPSDACGAPKCLPQQWRVFLAVLHEHFLQRLRPV